MERKNWTMLNRMYVVMAVLLILSAVVSKTLACGGCGKADPNKNAEPNKAAMLISAVPDAK